MFFQVCIFIETERVSSDDDISLGGLTFAISGELLVISKC